MIARFEAERQALAPLVRGLQLLGVVLTEQRKFNEAEILLAEAYDTAVTSRLDEAIQRLVKNQATDVPERSDIFGPDRRIKSDSKCPSGGTYSLGAVKEPTRCSIHGPNN